MSDKKSIKRRQKTDKKASSCCQKIIEFIREDESLRSAIFCLLIALVLVTLFSQMVLIDSDQKVLQFILQRPAKVKHNTVPDSKPCLRHSWLDGLCSENASEPINAYAVMVENHSQSRPQSGLQDASIVFEAYVEGSITRFLSIYSSAAQTKEIGPVRSARPYYVRWADDFDALYAHVGGSPDALNLIRELGVKDLDQFFYDRYFWRSSDRYAPHNVYTSMENLNMAAKARGWEFREIKGWNFNEASKELYEQEDVAKVIKVSYGGVYSAEWLYDEESGSYARSQAGSAHLLENGDSLTAENIIAIESSQYVIDDVGRLSVRTSGEGKAMAFINGKVINASWSNQENDIIRFYNQEAEELVLNPGKTWIHVLPAGTALLSFLE